MLGVRTTAQWLSLAQGTRLQQRPRGLGPVCSSLTLVPSCLGVETRGLCVPGFLGHVRAERHPAQPWESHAERVILEGLRLDLPGDSVS